MKKKTMRQSSALKKTREFSLCSWMALALVPLLAASCHSRLHDVIDQEENGKVPVTILVNSLSDPAYAQTRATVDVGQVCSNLSFCIYPCEGESFDKIQINQSRGEESFGTVSQNLTVGVHRIVVVAHNGDKNATMTNAESIAFSSNTILKTTDTYCWAGEVNVTQQTGTVVVSLTRATAMFRLRLTDAQIPAQVCELQFAYKGGSAAVNPFTLEGTTKSNQKESFAILDHSQKTFEVYTFPRYEEKNGVRNLSQLEITVTAIDVYGNAVKERVLTDVPVLRNRITECTGEFFVGGVLEYTNIGFGGLQVESDWAGTDPYTLPD
jgi:hypothetical protein